MSRRSYCIYRRGNKKRKIHNNVTAQGFGSVGVFVMALMVFVGVLYLFSANEIAMKGDQIYDIEKDIKELARENERLVIEKAELRSLENIEDVIKNKNMQEITDPVYISKETRVALED